MLQKNLVNRGTAKKVFAEVFTNNVDPEAYVKEHKLALVTDNSAIRTTIEQVLAANEKSVSEYRGGKAQAMQFLIGQSMKALRGQAPAQEVTAILKELLG
jgi:aspartyl-tRNA(Asn)/glutamyl-tRNA(Gln) amidotransferase subunit B